MCSGKFSRQVFLDRQVSLSGRPGVRCRAVGASGARAPRIAAACGGVHMPSQLLFTPLPLRLHGPQPAACGEPFGLFRHPAVLHVQASKANVSHAPEHLEPLQGDARPVGQVNLRGHGARAGSSGAVRAGHAAGCLGLGPSLGTPNLYPGHPPLRPMQPGPLQPGPLSSFIQSHILRLPPPPSMSGERAQGPMPTFESAHAMSSMA